jgi:type II secretory pathway pseudopilin PulG
MYRMSLELLTFLGDLVGRPVDLFKLPTPREAGIPEQGAYGIKIASTEARMSFELAFESNPAEILFAGSGYSGLAVAGIIAAISIPAYQDYTVRAKVVTAVGATSGARALIAEFVQTHGRFPNEAELAGFDLSPFSADFYELAISPDDGRITLGLTLEPVSGETIVLVPQLQGKQLSWGCSSSMADKYLPASCK